MSEESEQSWHTEHRHDPNMQARQLHYRASAQQQPLRSNAPCTYGFYNPLSTGYYQYGSGTGYGEGAPLASFASPHPPPQTPQPQLTAEFGSEQPAPAVRPISAVAIHRQKLFQLGRTISSPEMPTPPPAAIAANAASPQSLSSSSSSLYFPPPNGQLSHSLPCVDRSTSVAASAYPWAADPYHVTAASSLFLPHQHSGSPSPSHSDSRSPPGSAVVGPNMPLLSPLR